jgi:hypothetical protein
MHVLDELYGVPQHLNLNKDWAVVSVSPNNHPKMALLAFYFCRIRGCFYTNLAMKDTFT